jgi:hypothetical protein
MDVNPFSHSFQSDPNPTYAWLRENEPVYHNEEMHFWALPRFEDVLGALHDDSWSATSPTTRLELKGCGRRHQLCRGRRNDSADRRPRDATETP